MSIARWTDLLDDVMPHVPGASIEIATHAIKRATIEFCTDSLVMRATSDPLTIEAGQGVVDLDSPVSATVCVKALSAKLAGDADPLDPKTPEWLDEWNPDWRTELGTPRYFTQDNPEQLVVALAPESELRDALVVQMAIAPKLNAPGVEGWILQRFAEAIASGALGRLMAIPKKPWSNAQLASVHLAAFNASIGAAAAMAAKGFGRAPLRTKACP